MKRKMLVIALAAGMSLSFSACGGGTVTAAGNHDDAPSLATIARKCGSGLSLYKNDDGKQQLDASGDDFSGNTEVDCVLDSGAVPSDVADAITEAQHGSETVSKTGSTGTYDYKWKVEFVDNPNAPAVKFGMTSISLIEK